MSKKKFPMTVKRGNVRAKIYFTPNNGCDAYTVSYYFGGKRQRKMFASLELAHTEAEMAATKISAGEMDVLHLTSEDRLAYVRALGMLQELNTPLEMAVMQFAEAAKILEGGSLVEAARFYAKQHRRKLAVRTVEQVVAEMLEAKRAEGMSAVYVKELRSRLNRFAKQFRSPISMVLAAEVQDYVNGLQSGGRSKNNTRKSIRTLFHYAQARGYLPKGATEADDVKRVKEAPQPIGIFTVAQLAKLLQHADDDLVPFLVFGAFSGLRHAEILRLDWSEVDLAGGHIEVKAAKAKTASRRLVPIAENLRAWLAPRHRDSGRVITMTDHKLIQRIGALAKSDAVKLAWPHNGLRHSFISYRVAEIQNVAQVALEAGNSPQIIFRNYRELVKPAAAKQWFAVGPEVRPAIRALPAPEQLAA